MRYQRKRAPLDPCPVEEVLEIIGGKWKTRILYLLATQSLTFAELRRALPGITQQVLADQVRALGRDRIVNRQRITAGKTYSRYSLTEEGRSLIPVLCLVADWGRRRLSARGVNWDSPLPVTVLGA